MVWVGLRIRVSELVGMARVRIRAHKDRSTSTGTWREREQERGNVDLGNVVKIK